MKYFIILAFMAVCNAFVFSSQSNDVRREIRIHGERRIFINTAEKIVIFNIPKEDPTILEIIVKDHNRNVTVIKLNNNKQIVKRISTSPFGSHLFDDEETGLTKVTEPVNIGESPVWDRRLGKLFFVDIHHGRIMEYDYEKQTMNIAVEYPGNDIAPIILTKNPNIMIAGMNRQLVKIVLNNKTAEPEILHTVQHEKQKNRFNDGKADSRGRVWIGTIGEEPNASLYKFTKENITKPSVMIPRVTISNGLTWSLDGTVFYYIDTATSEIVQYDFYAETGNIANKKVVFGTKGKEMGHPDGMTIDEEGNLWVALYGGGSIIQIDPAKGTLLRRIPIPASHTTSVGWGGPDLDILFVTTSKRSLTQKERGEQPGAGSLYAVTNLGTKGHPDFEADI